MLPRGPSSRPRPSLVAATSVSSASVYPAGEALLPTSARKPARQSARLFPSYAPLPRSPKRLQVVDGLRALAISLVFLNHASGTSGFPAWMALISRHPQLGLAGTGVKFFFVISGYLITSILLRELDRSGTIDRLAFLRRRARRLVPTLLVFVAVVALLRLAGAYTFPASALVAAVTFTGRLGTWELGHLWSLAVQEQFYLVWTTVLVLGGRRLASLSALTLVVAVPVARLVHATLQPDASSLYLGNGASIDTIAAGCLLALHRDRLSTSRWFSAAAESLYTIPLLYLLGSAAALVGYRPGLMLRAPLVAAAVVLLLERCIRHPERGLARVLASRGAVYVGSASYSLYLWQQLFLNPGSKAWATAFPVNLVAAVGVGLLSWHFVERSLATRVDGWLARPGTPRAPAPSADALAAPPFGRSAAA